MRLEAFMTELTELQKKLTELLPNVTFKFQEPMAKHTSFRIGGEVEAMAFPKNPQELSEILKVSSLLDCNLAILGAGTNVLAPDAGISGLLICLKDCMDGMEQVDETHIRVAAGVTMTRCAVYAANLGRSGLEFAHGIPGSVGGGVYMNAGAYGGEICQVCHSVLEDEGGIVVSVIFTLEKKEPEAIKARMKELMSKRSASQPLDLPSAGSAFKRPVGGYAAALIDQTGLKGFRVGGAAISEKHAGFAVNLGGATAADVQELLRQVSDKVFESTGIRLEPEVRIW